MKSVCLHPTIEKSILEWFDKRTTPAVFLVGPPGVGKTTLAYRVMQQKNLRISEFNASHTRSGACFRKIILPLLERGGVINMMENGQQGGLGVVLDEIDGLSAGEKGGLQTLLTYLREWKPSRPGIPVIFISNSIQQRILMMISRYCLTFRVGMADQGQIQQLIGQPLPPLWIKNASGDLRPLLRGEFNPEKSKINFFDNDDEEGEYNISPPDGVVPLAKWCLYSQLDPFLVLEMENNDGNLAGLVIAENLPDRIEGVKGNTRDAWDLYLKLFDTIQTSDYADYWAFFYQTWRLLALSQDVKINTMNLFLVNNIPWTKQEPSLESIRYTPVLTKQSALFNAWKLLCEISDQGKMSGTSFTGIDTQGIPIRLTPQALIKGIKMENENGGISTIAIKKDTRKKKMDSMLLDNIWRN